jgi:hypothetical protein
MRGRAPTFRLPPDVPVDGLGIGTHEATWLGAPAASTLLAEAGRAGLREGEGPDVVTLEAGCVATAAALRAFVAQTAGLPGDVVAVVSEHPAAVAAAPALGGPARLVRLRGGGPASPERLARAAVVTLPARWRVRELALLDRVDSRRVPLASAPELVVRISAWPGLLWANLLALPDALAAALPGSALTAPFRVALAALRAGSWQPEAIGARLVRRAAGARVHPSATVEGSWLMEGAYVDAGAVVRHAILGPGAVVEPQGLVIGAVLGPGARVQRRGFVTFGVVDAAGVVGGALQLGLVGPSAQLKIGGILLDQHLSGPVRVRSGDGLVDAPLGLIGAALGARAMVGAGVAVAAGRLVPPDVAIAAGADQVLLRCDVASPGPHRVRDGGLEPC